MNKQEIIDYINQLQNEVENGTASIEECFWTGTNTIKEMLQKGEWYQMTDREKQREKKRIEKEINELQNDNFYRIVLKDKKRFDENIGKIIKLKDELKELDLWQ